ncbi:GFA family protein [Altererythrobacter arenosus]|uniref:GFA family protein n=1 Tax=Altererythrobacter arenosus TaxID=3032592 RepID=A0ABY8FP51_9SPHN|nr:GFA family protein [Altererythrobacter sp. CAU 1644]WFL76798.1 GFA family protein [Altererythrobacter sp. CAU 1644]
MTEAIEKTGGCQCGKVRYRATIDPAQAYLCHCRMCQRATGGVSIAFIGLQKADIAWESGPDWYASSPIARRPFCSNCGTPLGFAFNDSEGMDITVGSLDEPYGIEPHWHFASEKIHEAWVDTSNLPRKKITDYEKLNQMWIDATGSVPE